MTTSFYWKIQATVPQMCLKLTYYQLFDDHLVANKRLSKTRLKTNPETSINFRKSKTFNIQITSPSILPYQLFELWFWDLHFPHLLIVLTSSHGKIVTKNSHEILCKDDDVKRFVFYPCLSTEPTWAKLKKNKNFQLVAFCQSKNVTRAQSKNLKIKMLF